MNKADFLKLVNENELVKTSLLSIKDEKELRTTRAAISEIIGDFYDNLMGVATTVQKNPEELKKMVSEVESELFNNEKTSSDTKDT